MHDFLLLSSMFCSESVSRWHMVHIWCLGFLLLRVGDSARALVCSAGWSYLSARLGFAMA